MSRLVLFLLPLPVLAQVALDRQGKSSCPAGQVFYAGNRGQVACDGSITWASGTLTINGTIRFLDGGVDGWFRLRRYHTAQPNLAIEFNLGGNTVAALRDVSPPYAGENAVDFRLFGRAGRPAIFSLVGPDGTSYADFTYNGSDADIDVSPGGLNLRPSGNVNIWHQSSQVKLRVGSFGFGQAFDLWHDGSNAVMSSTTGNIISQSPFEVQSAFLQSSTSANFTVLGNVRFGSAASTIPNRTGTSLPAACAVGETFFKTDATPGQNLYLCTAANTWTQIIGSGGGGGSVTSVFGRTGAVVAQAGDYNASQITNTPSGNVSATNVQAAINELDAEKQPLIQAGSANQFFAWDKTWRLVDWSYIANKPTTFNAGQLQGRNVASTAPSDGQVLAWNAASSQWQPTTVSGGGSQPPRTVQISLGDGTNVIPTGLSRWIVVPHSGTITACIILADTSGNLTVKWLKRNAGLPGSTDSIGTCSLSGAQYVKNTTLSGWTTTVSADDWLRVEVTGTTSNIKAATVALVIQP